MNDLNIGPLKISFMGSDSFEALPIGGDQIKSCERDLALITAKDGLALEVAYMKFSSGERDVRVLDVTDSPNPYIRLGHGGRLGAHPFGSDKYFCELRVMKLRDDKWGNPVGVDEATIDQILGYSASGLFREIGGSSIGTRERLTGDVARRRGLLAVSFDHNNIQVPLAAYAITRPLAMLRRYGLE
jgi:hypothetical protein